MLLNHLYGIGKFYGKCLAAPDGWRLDTLRTGCTLTSDWEKLPDNDACLRIDVNAAGDGNAEKVKLRVWWNTANAGSALHPSDPVTLTFRLLADTAPTNLKLRVLVNSVNAGGTSTEVVAYSGAVTGTGEWVEYTATGTVRADAVSADISIQVRAADGHYGDPVIGTLWIDNVRMTTATTWTAAERGTTRLIAIQPDTGAEEPLKTLEKYDGLWHDWPSQGQILWDAGEQPQILCLTRVHYSHPTDGVTVANPVSHADAQANGWLLLKSDGSHLTDSSGYIFNDMGNAGYRQAALDSILAMARERGAYWLFFDNLVSSIANLPGSPTLLSYATDAAFQAAQTGFLQYVAPELHAAGIRIMVNLTDTTYCSGIGRTWLDLVDGGCIEWGFVSPDFDHGTHNIQAYDGWRWRVNSLSCNTDKVVVIKDWVETGDETTRMFGWASYLLGCHSNTFYCLSEPANKDIVWKDWFAMDLGDPYGAMVDKSGYFQREFTGGIVYANPYNVDQDIIVPYGCKDMDGNFVYGLQALGAKDGLVLERIPRIAMGTQYRTDVVVGDDYKFNVLCPRAALKPANAWLLLEGADVILASSIADKSLTFEVPSYITTYWKPGQTERYQVVIDSNGEDKIIETGWFIPRRGVE